MKAIDHFRLQGYNCPEFSNPSTFFMQCMNPEGLMIQQIKERGEEANIELTEEIKELFHNRVDKMVEFYRGTSEFKAMSNHIHGTACYRGLQ